MENTIEFDYELEQKDIDRIQNKFGKKEIIPMDGILMGRANRGSRKKVENMGRVHPTHGVIIINMLISETKILYTTFKRKK